MHVAESVRSQVESLKKHIAPVIAKARAEKVEVLAYVVQARQQVKTALDAKKVGLEGVWSTKGMGGTKQVQETDGGVTVELHGDSTQIQRNVDGSVAVLMSGDVAMMLPALVVEHANPEGNGEGDLDEPVIVQLPGNEEKKDQVQLHKDISVWLQPAKQVQVHLRPNGFIACALPHARVQIDKSGPEDRFVLVYLPSEAKENPFPGFKVGLLPEQAVLVEIPEGSFGVDPTGWVPRKVYVDREGSFTVVAADGSVSELKPDGRLLVQQTLSALDDASSDVKKALQSNLASQQPQPPVDRRPVNKGKRCGGGFVLPPKPKPKPKPPKKRDKAKEMNTTGSDSGSYAKLLLDWLRIKQKELQQRKPVVQTQINDARATFEKAKTVWQRVQGIIDGGSTQRIRDKARECVAQMEGLLSGVENAKDEITVQKSADGSVNMYTFLDGTKLQRSEKENGSEVLMCMVEGGAYQKERVAGANEIIVLDELQGEQIVWPVGSKGPGVETPEEQQDGQGSMPAVSWASPNGEQLQILQTGVVMAMVMQIGTGATKARDHYCTVQIDPRTDPMRVSVIPSPQAEGSEAAVQLLASRDKATDGAERNTYGLVAGSTGKKEQISENGHFTVEMEDNSSSNSSNSGGEIKDADFPRMSLHKDDSLLVERADGSQFHLKQGRLLSLTELPGDAKWDPRNNGTDLDGAFPSDGTAASSSSSSSSPVKKLNDAKHLDSKLNSN